MTQADSVHSTPPANTSAIDAAQSPAKPHSRRSVLGAIAAATAAWLDTIADAAARSFSFLPPRKLLARLPTSQPPQR